MVEAFIWLERLMWQRVFCPSKSRRRRLLLMDLRWIYYTWIDTKSISLISIVNHLDVSRR